MNIQKLLTGAVTLLMITAFAVGPALGAGNTKAGATWHKPFIHKGSDFSKMELKDEKGENLGKVRDVLLDERGELRYVVVAPAGTTGDKLVPIPFSEGMWRFEKDAAVVRHFDKAELAKAPTVTTQELDKLNNPEFDSKVQGYYREAIKK